MTAENQEAQNEDAQAKTEVHIPPLGEYSPDQLLTLELTEWGEAFRMLEDHGKDLLIASEEDGSYTPFTLDRRSQVWQIGIEQTQAKRPSAVLLEWIAETNRAYRERIDNAKARDEELFWGDVPETKRKQRLAQMYGKLDTLSSPQSIARTVQAIVPVILNREARNEDSFGIRRCKRADIDTMMRYIGAPNGIIDLRTGKLLPSGEGADKFVASMITDDFDPDATHPDVDLLFAHLSPVVRSWTLNTLAHNLSGNGSKAANIIVGDRDGGKTTLLQAVKAAGGKYVGALGKGALAPTKQGEAASPDMQSVMPPVRIAFAPEMEDIRIDNARFKAVTGSDSQAWRPLYQSTRTQRPSASIFLVGNSMPTFGRGMVLDSAATSRLRIVRYGTIDEKKRKPYMMKAFDVGEPDSKKRRQALMAELIGRAAIYGPDNAPKMPDVVKEMTQQHIEELRGEEGNWLAEVLVKAYKDDGQTRDTSVYVSTTQLYEAAMRKVDPDGAKKLKRPWGLMQKELTNMAIDIHGLGSPEIVDRTGKARKVVRGWRGWKLEGEL